MPARDQRCTGDDALHSGVDFISQRGVRNHAREQAFCVCLTRIPHTAFDQYLQCGSAAHHRQHGCQLIVGDGKPKAIDRHAKARRFTGNSKITLARQLQPAAHTGAMNHRHHRVPAFSDRFKRAIHKLAVVLNALLACRTNRFELGDVRACRERLIARAAQHDAAQAVIR